MLGNGRLEAMCFDGEKRLAHIRGKMRKKVSLEPSASLFLRLCCLDPEHGPRAPNPPGLLSLGPNSGS